uniref:CHK kinase-like domain-containing protein n=1 Tax=Panagrolaimus superbus TaxID=310955 RepID=A0A914Y7F3_9BILA
MEDLTNRGKSLLYFDSINLTQIKSFVRHLARMHKNILSADPKLWKGKHLKGSECFASALSALESAYEPFLKKCKREEDFRPLIEKYKKISTSTDYYFYAIQQSFIDLKMPSILVHGDPHSGNILWQINCDGDIENEISAIIDWQTMHEGSPMEDLARFLTHCTNGIVRRQAEAMIFEFYLECLTMEFGGDSSRVPYTIEQLKKAYNFAFVIQTFFTISDLSFFLEAINETNDGIKAAFFDMGILKAWNNLQDCDGILQGDLKEYFEKYGK